MKFRTKYAPLTWEWFAIVLALVAGTFFGANRDHLKDILPAFALIVGSLSLLEFQFTYLELTSDCLRKRRLWKKIEIPWNEVTRVSWLGFAQHAVMISYGHQPEDYGWLAASPGNRKDFIAALHKYAPHATFEL